MQRIILISLFIIILIPLCAQTSIGQDDKLERELIDALHKKRLSKKQLHREAWGYPGCDSCDVKIWKVKYLYYSVLADSQGVYVRPPRVYLDVRKDHVLPVIESTIRTSGWKPVDKNGSPLPGIVIEINLEDLAAHKKHNSDCKCVRIMNYE